VKPEAEWFEMIGKTIPKESMLAFLDQYPELIQYTLDLSIRNHQPHSWRAAWLIKLKCKKNDPLVIPYLERMIAAIDGKQDGHQRELMKIVIKLPWNEDQEGILFDKCLVICRSLSKSPSVRIVAFQILTKLILKYPELWHEIQFMVEEDYFESLSTGIKNGFKKDLDYLRKTVLPQL
jgi:hypothetical protein